MLLDGKNRPIREEDYFIIRRKHSIEKHCIRNDEKDGKANLWFSAIEDNFSIQLLVVRGKQYDFGFSKEEWEIIKEFVDKNI